MRDRFPCPARSPCTCALRWCCALLACFALPAFAATLQEKARESGCARKPNVVEGTVYKCLTESGAYSYFNWPGGESAGSPNPASAANGGRSTTRPTVIGAPPPGFPRVDAATQKSRDDMRRKVLTDELASEEKLLTQARAAYGSGAPPALPEEQADAERYRSRIARLRQEVQLHERNVEAIRKELATVR